MAIENVKNFFELLKSDEELAREIAKIKDEIQNKGETVDYEQIISKKVIPLAKEHGLDFTIEDFLKYTNSMVQQGELSDDDLLNVSGGMNLRQGLATGLLMLTVGTTGLSLMGNLQAPGGGGSGSGGQVAPDTSYSQSIDNGTKAPVATTQEAKNDNSLVRQVMLNTEVDDNTEKSAIADETNVTTENNNFNEEDEDITPIEQEVNEVADENARTAEKDNKVAEATEEDDGIEMDGEEINLGELDWDDLVKGEEIDFSHRRGYEDLDANKTELKDINIDWSEEDNKALEDFFVDEDSEIEVDDEGEEIEVDDEGEEIEVDDEDFGNLNNDDDFNFGEDFNIENEEKTENQEEADEENAGIDIDDKDILDKIMGEGENEDTENKFMFAEDEDKDKPVKKYHMNEEDQQLWEDAYKENNDDKIENNEEDENKENAEEGAKEFEEINTDKVESANPEIKEETKEEVKIEDAEKTENQEATKNNEIKDNENNEEDSVKEAEHSEANEETNEENKKDNTEVTEKQEYKKFGKFKQAISSYSDMGKHIYGEMEKVGFNIDNFSNKEDAVSQIKNFISGVENALKIGTLNGEFADGSTEKQQLDKIKESYSNYAAKLKRNPEAVEKHTIDGKAEWPDRVKKLCDVLNKCEGKELAKGNEPFWQDLEELGGRIGKESGNGFYFNDALFPKVKTNKNRNDFKQNELKKVKMAYDKYFGSNNN